MIPITKDLYGLPRYELIDILKNRFESNIPLSKVEEKIVLETEVFSYDILGIIGLLTKDKPRILLGRLQPFDTEIQQWCKEFTIVLADLEKIADDYLEDNFTAYTEQILRDVMNEYPKDCFLKNNN